MEEVREHGLFLNIEQSVNEIDTIIAQHTYLKPMFEDYKNSIIFQKQLILNVYHFLSIEDEKLIYDSGKSIDRPLIFLIVSFITMSEDISLLKLSYSKNKFLLLLVSIFFAKKMTRFLYEVLYETDEELVEENVLDLIHLSPLSIHEDGFNFIKNLQKVIILELKGEDYTFLKFRPFIKEAIINAKKLNQTIYSEGYVNGA